MARWATRSARRSSSRLAARAFGASALGEWRDADLRGAASLRFLRTVESSLRAHSPNSGPAVRLGAVTFLHRFGSTLNVDRNFHCVVINSVFEPASADGGFHVASGVDATAQLQAHCAGGCCACVRSQRPATGR